MPCGALFAPGIYRILRSGSEVVVDSDVSSGAKGVAVGTDLLAAWPVFALVTGHRSSRPASPYQQYDAPDKCLAKRQYLRKHRWKLHFGNAKSGRRPSLNAGPTVRTLREVCVTPQPHVAPTAGTATLHGR